MALALPQRNAALSSSRSSPVRAAPLAPLLSRAGQPRVAGASPAALPGRPASAWRLEAAKRKVVTKTVPTDAPGTGPLASLDTNLLFQAATGYCAAVFAAVRARAARACAPRPCPHPRSCVAP
jgi:hypothetical protein